MDERSLLRYVETFVGFGSLDADLWFVGMEQGGGETVAELERRVGAWRQLGGGEVLDLGSYCEQIDERRWHGTAAKLQPTLSKIIRMVLAARGVEPTPSAIRQYQSERLGRTGEETLVAELMPLPSRSVKHWIYGDFTAVPYLRTREAYLRELLPKRMALLRTLIGDHKPRAVVFLGWSYRREWCSILGEALEERSSPPPGVLVGKSGTTVCVVARHPTSYGVSNHYYDEIGRLIADGGALVSPSRGSNHESSIT